LLKKITGFDKFKIPELLLAVHTFKERRNDLLLILPAGSGKTLVYLLLTAMEHGRTTIVFSPYLTLQQDLVRRCEHGFKVAIWDEFSVPTGHIDLLFIQVEKYGTGADDFIRQLFVQNKLNFVVFDEAHLFFNITFRQFMEKLFRIRKLPFPLLLVSATVPPSQEANLMKIIHNDNVDVIRKSSVITNMKYCVRKFASKLQAIAALKEMV
jgi:superfamily II DNA helicase RecQ